MFLSSYGVLATQAHALWTVSHACRGRFADSVVFIAGRLSAVGSPAPSGWGTPFMEKTPKPSLARKAPLSTVTMMNIPDTAAVGPEIGTDAPASLTDDLLKL